MSGLVVLKAHKVNKVLPPGYRVDHNPDVAVLRRPDGSVVAYFPIWTMSPERILRQAERDLASEHLAIEPLGPLPKALRSHPRGS